MVHVNPCQWFFWKSIFYLIERMITYYMLFFLSLFLIAICIHVYIHICICIYLYLYYAYMCAARVCAYVKSCHNFCPLPGLRICWVRFFRDASGRSWLFGGTKHFFQAYVPSGELTVCYWTWPLFIVDFPIKNGDVP